jgi:thioredoxin 1
MIALVAELNGENFTEMVGSNDIVIVDIWAEWCGPCKALSPILDQVAAEAGSRVLVGKLDADKNSTLCKDLEIRNIPTLLFYKNGEILDKTVGMRSKKEILEIVNRLLEN